MSDPRTELEIIDELRRERDSLAGKLEDAKRLAKRRESDWIAQFQDKCDLYEEMTAKLTAAEQRAEKAEAGRDEWQRIARSVGEKCDASLAREEKLCEALETAAQGLRYSWQMLDAICATDDSFDRRKARDAAATAFSRANRALHGARGDS